MFWKKSKKKDAASAGPEKNLEHNLDKRIHAEGLGNVWLALTGIDPVQLLPQVLGTVIAEGGTRPAWQWERNGQEYKMVAWPADQPARAGVLFAGPMDGDLKPMTCVPLLEGLPNNLCVAQTHPRQEGLGGDVATEMLENKRPMWFFDPFFDRDREDLTPGVTHTFWLSGVALAIRKALLDNITLTHGPQFDAYAQEWLASNPDRKPQDVPPLKLDIKGKHFIMPGRFFGEYQFRAPIESVEECQLDKMPVKILYLAFPFDDRPDLRLPLYVSQFVAQDLKLEERQEIDAYVWLQGRVIDMERQQSS